jgi:hypothetical protein
MIVRLELPMSNYEFAAQVCRNAMPLHRPHLLGWFPVLAAVSVVAGTVLGFAF